MNPRNRPRVAYREHSARRAPGAVHTILSFCASNAISPSKYYSLKRQGRGPVEIDLDGRIIITPKANRLGGASERPRAKPDAPNAKPPPPRPPHDCGARFARRSRPDGPTAPPEIRGDVGVIKIRFVGDKRAPGLIRTTEDQAWARTPIGMAGRLGSGPPNQTCSTCSHIDLVAAVWTDRGKAAPCIKRRQLTRDRRAQPAPLDSIACSYHARRPDAAAAIAAADRHLGRHAAEKRAQIARFEAMTSRLYRDLRELGRLQGEGSQLSQDEAATEAGNWEGWEPDG
jgi:hypothetical protein